MREAVPALGAPVFEERLAGKVTDTTAEEVTEKDQPHPVAGEEVVEGAEAAGTNFVASSILLATGDGQCSAVQHGAVQHSVL